MIKKILYMISFFSIQAYASRADSSSTAKAKPTEQSSLDAKKQAEEKAIKQILKDAANVSGMSNYKGSKAQQLAPGKVERSTIGRLKNASHHGYFD